MPECTNFPLDEEECKTCKEYPCSLVLKREWAKPVDEELLYTVIY